MSDGQLIQRCADGDSSAWSEFLDKYSRLIYNYILKVLKTRKEYENHDYAGECMKELFHDFFCFLKQDNAKKLRSFQGRNGCSLASWLRVVVINFTRNYLRKNKPILSLDEDSRSHPRSSLKDMIEDVSDSALELLEQGEISKALIDCIANLSMNDKYLLELISRGLRLEEIREHLNLARGAVDMQKMRLMRRLRDCFNSKGFFS